MDLFDCNIFDYVTTKGIIIDNNILSPDYMPPRLIGRDDQIKELAFLMRPLFRNGTPNNALIFGSPGCGKTATSRYILGSLMEKLRRDPIGVNVKWLYIHCKKIQTTHGILYSIIKQLNPETDIKRSGYSMDYYYDAVFSVLKTLNTSLILILDEIDFLRSDDVLYNFSRAVPNGEIDKKQFIRVIGLSNSRKFEGKLDPRVLSSMGFEKIRFPSYTTDDIFHILKDRTDLAFTPDSISMDTLVQCAQDIAYTGGDIRKALNILQMAAKLAEVEGSNCVSLDHIRNAEDQVQNEDVINSVLTLPLHHKIILLSVLKFMNRLDTISTGDVTKMYEALCIQIGEKPSPRQTVSKWISSLDMQGYIQSVLVNRGKKGGVTRVISIPSEYIEQTKKALYEDFQLEDLVEYFPVINGGT